jgi:hypothetical protein
VRVFDVATVQLVLENFFELPDSGTVDAAIAPDAVCPFLGREAWVNASGRFDPCCAPDAARAALGSFGRLYDPTAQTPQRLMDVWDGDAYRKLTREYLSNPLCRGCNMRKPPAAPAVGTVLPSDRNSTLS